jgi:hypothetical protein
MSAAFFLLLIILFLPVVPRYLIKFSALGWGALPIMVLYMILVVEISYRERKNLLQQGSRLTVEDSGIL